MDKGSISYLATCATVAMAVAVSGAAEGHRPASDKKMQEICVQLPTTQCVARLALDSAEEIESAFQRAGTLVRIAVAQTAAGDTQGARMTLAKAYAATGLIGEAEWNETLWQFSPDDPEDETRYLRSLRLVNIASASATMGSTDTAEDQLKEATSLAAEIDDNQRRGHSLITIAMAQAETGMPQAAREIMSIANMDLYRYRYFSDQIHALALAQAKAGDIRGALATALSIPGDPGDDTYSRDQALCDIGTIQAAAGDERGALYALRMIELSYFQIPVVESVGIARAHVGDIDGTWNAVWQIDKIFDSALEQSKDVDWRTTGDSKASLILAIIEAHLAAKEFTSAIKIVDSGENSDVLPGFNTALARSAIAKAQTHALAMANDLEGARNAAISFCRELERHHCVELLTLLADTHARTGNAEATKTLLSTATTIVKSDDFVSFSGEEERHAALAALFNIRLQLGELDAAMHLLPALLDVSTAKFYWDKEAAMAGLTAIALNAHRAGETEGAQMTLAVAAQRAATLEKEQDRILLAVLVGLAYETMNDTEMAAKVLSEALGSAMAVTDERQRALMLADFAFTQASGTLPKETDFFQ